jgi:hypothetical protein
MTWNEGSLQRAEVTPDHKNGILLLRVPKGATLKKVTVSGKMVPFQQAQEPEVYHIDLPWRMKFLLHF